ncbi:MAG TPA: M23 family metallopeptidase [Thermoanaerobaculia bacterium]|nr:M23 family metallopeptidase [Thermoanaerobaculia bacterium]
MNWRRILGRLLALALLILLLIWALPRLKTLIRVVRLYREPAPTSLPVPVQGIEPSQLADTWGAARSEGRTHEGIDIFALRGTPVISATHGAVVRKGLNRLGGRVVGVIGPAGWYHYYAHLDAWSVIGIGDWVEAGTVLGYVGDSGNAKGTPTHLHYGVYVQGGATNPYPLLVPMPLRRPPPSARAPSGSPRRRHGARRRSAAASR